MTDNNDNLNTASETRRRRAPRRDGKGSNASANASLDIKPSSPKPMSLPKKKAGSNCWAINALSRL